MSKKWSKETKKKVTELICEAGESTGRVAEAMEIPLKTVEKWVTAYNKNPKVYDEDPENILMERLRQLERENEILKKTLYAANKIN